MNICISPESLKLFGNYIARQLPKILTKDKTADALLNEMFSKASADFNSSDLSGERLKEVVLQHMSLVPELALSYLSKNPTLKSKNLVTDLTELSSLILDSVSSNNNESFQKSINALADIIMPTNPPAFSSDYDFRYNAIALVFEKTTNQEAFWTESAGYKENIIDPKKKFEFDVLRNVIQNINNYDSRYSGLKYKMIRLGDIANNPKVQNTVLNADSNYPVFVLVDKTGKLVEFDSSGIISESGSIPIFTFKQDRLEFDEQVKLKKEKLALNKNLSSEEVDAIIENELNEHLNLINSAKEKLKLGENVFFDLDIPRSSTGFIETDSKIQTPLTDITNIDKCNIEVKFTGKIPYPVITAEHSTKSKQLFQKPLSTLSDLEFEMLFQLLTNKDLKLATLQEDGSLRQWKEIRQTVRNELIKFFVDSYNTSDFFYYNSVDNTVKLGPDVISINDLTVEKLKEFANTRIDIKLDPRGVVNFLSDVSKVTALGQIYKGEDGNFYRAAAPRRSFSLDLKSTNFKNDILNPVSFENGTLTVKRIPHLDHIKNVSLTNIVPTSNNELRANGAYIAFKKTEQDLLDDVNFDVPEVVFKSLSQINQELKKPSSKKEAAALDWFENSPLKKIISLSISDEHHEYGPNFIANFIGNTINLYLGSNKTDIYHESFHAFFRGVLNSSERSDIYKALRSSPGYFKVVVNGNAKVVSFDEADDLELEEYLAEEFRKFASNKTKYSNKISDKITRAFEKIMNVLKSIFGNMSYADAIALNKINGTINTVFDNLYNGTFDVSNFNSSNNTLAWSSSEFVSSKKNDKTSFTLEEMNTAMQTMKSLLADFITYGLNIDSNTAVQGKSIQMLLTLAVEPVDSPRYKELSKIYETALKNSTPSGNGVYAFSENPKIISYAVEFIKKRLNQQLGIFKNQNDPVSLKQQKLLTKILENFGSIDVNDILDYIQNKPVDNLVSIFLNNHSFINFDPELDSSEFENSYADTNIYISEYKAKGNENTIDQLIDKQTKQLLESIHSYSEQGTGSLITNSLGVKQLRPFKSMVAKTAKLLANIHDAEDMCRALKQAALKDKEFDQIFRRLGDITEDRTTTDAEDKQWTNFWQSFNKSDVLLREFIIEKKIDDETNEVLITSRSGQSNTKSKEVIGSWRSNFNNLLTRSIYSQEETEGENKGKRYLDIAKIFEAYNRISDRGYVLISGTGPKVISSKNSPNKISGDIYTDTALPKAQTHAFDFLAEFGIELVRNDEVRKILIQGDSETSSGIVDLLNKSLLNRLSALGLKDQTKIFKFDDLFKQFNYKSDQLENGKNVVLTQRDLFGYRKQLQNLHYIQSNDYTNFSAYTAYGELQSEKTLNSSLTMMVTEINKATSYADLISKPGMEQFNYELNPQVVASYWLVDMFNLKPGHKLFGTRNAEFSISIENLSGNKIIEGNTDKGIATIDSDELSKFTSDFHLTLEGNSEILRSSDKSTSLTAFATRNKGNGDIRKKSNLVVNKEEIEKIFSPEYKNKGKILYQEFVSHLEAELITIYYCTQIKKDLIAKVPYTLDLEFDADFIERGTSFNIFDDILPPKLKTKLKALNISDSFTLEKTLASKKDLINEIEQSLVDFFTKESQKLYDEKNKDLIITDDKFEAYKLNKDEDVETTRLKLFRTVTINNFIQNISYASLFLGDSSIYDVENENYHKRIAGLISTGKIFRHDQAWLKKINSSNYNAYGFAKINSKSRTDFSYNGYLNTAVIKDTRIDSVLIEQYSKVLGIDQSDYESMKEADGQGWISFDAYRILNDSLGEWSTEQEQLYQKMLRGETLTDKDMNTTFPVRKFQFYGNVRNGNNLESSIPLSMMAFHKYSLMPLIPQLIKGTKLENLHNKMMNEGIDYVTMKTGSKLSSISKLEITKNKKNQDVVSSKVDVFYNDDRTINENTPFTKNQIHVKYLKSQIFIAAGYKGKITLPTQMRKIILLDLLDGGKPLDYSGTLEQWENLLNEYNSATSKSLKNKLRLEIKKQSKKYDWYLKYDEALTNLTSYLRAELLEDIDMKPVKQSDGTITYEGDSSKLVEYLKKQMSSKDLSSSEIEFILDPNDPTKLREDLSFSLVSEKIEEILVTMVDKKLRSLKVNGEALIQVSSAMFEKTFGEKVQNSSNELKFYYLKDSAGNILTDSKGKATFELMEVKIALQGDYKKLLHTTHADGKKIMVRDEEGNVDYNASLNRLNETIKNNASWLEKHKELLKLPGVRIPTQGRNALDAAQIVEFLPEYVGPYIILPTEIVAKNGSDFDIDKAFFMMKNLLRSGKTVEEIKYFSVSESVEDLSAKLDELYKLKKEVGDELNDEWNKQKDFINSNKELNIITKNAFAEINDITSEIEELKEKRKKLKQIKKLDITQLQEINSQINELYLQKNTLHDFVYEETVKLVGAIDTLKDKNLIIADTLKKFNLLKERNASIDDSLYAVTAKVNAKSVKGLENELTNLFIERLSFNDLSDIKSLLKANTTNDVEPHARKTGKSINKKFNKYSKTYSESDTDKISRTMIFNYRYNLEKQQENSVGMDGLGIAAVASTFYALFTTFGSKLNTPSKKEQSNFLKNLNIVANSKNYPAQIVMKAKNEINKFSSYSLKLPHNKKENSILLGLQNNIEGKSISDLISQLINGYVDVAADSFIFDAQGTYENTPALLFMVMAGVPMKTVIDLSSNPLVLRYNELRKLNSGVYASLDRTTKSSITAGIKINEMSQRIIEDELAEVIGKTLGDSTISLSYINNTNAEPFTVEELNKLVGSDPNTFRNVQVLAHYLEIDKMASDLNNFTQLTKYDTTKIRTISEAQKRIDDTKVFLSKNSCIPNFWFDQINKSSTGEFNNDHFIIDLFEQYFGIRNNKMLIKLSLSLREKNIDPVKLRSDFKNDFLWFLYQNAIYGEPTYTIDVNDKTQTYTLNEVDDLNQIVSIDNEQNIVTYGKDSFAIEVTSPRFIYALKYFTQDSTTSWVRFRLEYDALSKKYKDYNDEDFNDDFYMFDNPAKPYLDKGEAGRNVLIIKKALYNSGNIKAMFDSASGIVNMLLNFQDMHPELKTYSFFRDMKTDLFYDKGKNNIYFPELKSDPTLIDVYKENIEELKNHPAKEVSEFFRKFNHIAMMQTGFNSKSKYYLGSLIDQNYVQKTIDNIIGIEYIQKALDDLNNDYENKNKSNVETNKNKNILENLKINGQFITQYLDKYSKMLNDEMFNLKVRGYDYTVSKLDLSRIDTNDNLNSFNNVILIPIDYSGNLDGIFLDGSEFFEETTPMEFAKYLKDSGEKIILYKQKISAPTVKQQKELDKALLLLGVDNSKDFPRLIFKSNVSTEGRLSIAEIPVQKTKPIFRIIDNLIALDSTKAIGIETKALNPLYISSSKAYAENLKAHYNKALVNSNTRFNKDDQVWIFGSTITPNAYKGSDRSEYVDAINNTFEKHHKPLIDKALRSGVTTFNIGTASGIDQLATSYLLSKGLVKTPVYLSIGKYYKLTVDESKTDTKIEYTNYTEFEIRDAIEDIRSTAKDWFNSLSEEILLKNGKSIVNEKLVAAIKNRDSLNLNQYRLKVLYQFGTLDSNKRILVGDSILDSYIEEILSDMAISISNSKMMSRRRKINETYNTKAFTQPTEVKEGVQELFNDNPELASQVYEALGFKQTYIPKIKDIITIEFFINDKLIESKAEIIKLEKLDNNAGYSMNVVNTKSGKKYEIMVYENGEIYVFNDQKGNPRVGTDNIILELEQNVRPQITPQQKQEALQVYSQYLNTVFPGSEVKDIDHGRQDIEGFKEFVNQPIASSNPAVQTTEVKPIVKDLSRWADIEDATTPYTDKGIVVTRIGNIEEQFGNPFIGSKRRDKQGNLIESKVDNITVFNTIAEADQAYRDWLMGVKHQNIAPARRAWILKQINEGKLDGKTFLYYKPMEVTNNDGTIVKGGYHSHADTLAEIVEELRGTSLSNQQTSDVVTFDSIPGITPERKMQILINFVKKHSSQIANIEEAKVHINEALKEAKKIDMVIDKLKTCY